MSDYRDEPLYEWERRRREYWRKRKREEQWSFLKFVGILVLLWAGFTVWWAATWAL